ncbi:MAG: HAMP domain-containing histidine kinase [Bacteroidota bacterium]|nr:HAMP domain-containing histidine kinase [Bacteroidota bacterium]
MKLKLNHVAILMAASMLAMIGLVIFQYKWINHSRELYNEVFHQRACMALCSTLEEYGEGAICTNNSSCKSATSLADNLLLQEPVSQPASGLVENEKFQSDLRKTLDFYNIDLTYQISQTPGPQHTQSKTPTCSVNLPSDEAGQSSTILLDFPDQEAFMMGKLKFMIGASILILIFTAVVLLVANWWLIKQKRLLRKNVEIYNNMAHEFRTPLTNINLAASFLAKDITGSKESKFLEIISRENSKLIGQVERVLHLARLDHGQYDLRHEEISLHHLLEEVREEMNMQIDERKADVQIRIPAGLHVAGDRQHLTNVFRNLIDNALKYSSEDPVIMIKAVEQKEGIHISIRDNGIGIPPEQTEFIFEKFQRVPQGDRHEQKGFGLGLAYVRKIVELHKGHVRVDSELNKGSCFNVFLPKFS